MEVKKTDKRISRTKRLLQEAFIELLTEKEVHKITIQEIADRAEINRVTFYKHYLDVYDIYDKVKNDIFVELGLLILQYEKLKPEEFYKEFVTYVDENRKLFEMIFSPNNSGQIRDTFYEMMEGLFRKMQTEKHEVKLSDIKYKYVSHYHAFGLISIIEKWVKDGFEQPADFIVNIISEIDKHIEVKF